MKPSRYTSMCKKSTRNILVFTVAINGYQWKYRQLLKTHAAYAKRHGYHYSPVVKPGISLLGLEVAWLKISLILEALKAGYEWVIFLDADTRVSDTSPPVENICSENKDIFACRGFSGRINSGVLIIRNTENAFNFFTIVLQSAMSPIPYEDDVGWGENGHIIYFSKRYNCFGYLDARWNNNQDASLNDYIRHFSRGPIHHLFNPKFSELLLSKIYRYSLAIYKRILIKHQPQQIKSNHPRQYDFHYRLQFLTNKVINHYPCFFKT